MPEEIQYVLLLRWVLWATEERNMSEFESLGIMWVWEWQLQLQDPCKFEQVRIPFLALSRCHCCLNQWRDSHWILRLAGLAVRLLYWKGTQSKTPWCSRCELELRMAKYNCSSAVVQHNPDVPPWRWLVVFRCKWNPAQAGAAVWHLRATRALCRHRELQQGAWVRGVISKL